MAKQVPGDNQGLAPLNDSDVAAMTDSGSFSRGRTYFRRGYIHDTVIQGNAIEARCEGSGYEPYVVKATLHTEGQRGANPSSYSCTCPRGGFCKHIVALLLTWIDNPDSFARLTDLEAILANRSSDDLIAIVKAMVARHPDLRSLVELEFPPAASPNTSTVNVEALRRDAGRAMQRMVEREEEQDWESEYEPPLEFIHLLDLARRWATEDYWANVQTVCSVLLKEVEKGAGSLSYVDDTVADLTSGCLLLLTDALDVQSDLPEADRFPPESRLALFRTLFEFWQFDLYRRDSSEMGYEVPEIICRHATGDERQEVESWIAELPEPHEQTRDHVNSGIFDFQVQLMEAGGATSEQMYQRFREAGMWQPAFDMLIELGRHDDAMSTARHHLRTFPEILNAMNDIAALGPDWKAQAIQVIEDFAWEVEGKQPLHDAKLKVWLNHQRGTTSPGRAPRPRVVTQRRKGDT